MITPALDHALAAKEHERAAALAAENALTLLMRGEVATVQRWLESLPQQTVLGHPRLCIDQAWVLHLNQRPDVIEPLLQAAERGLMSSDLAKEPRHSSWLGEVLALRAWIKRDQGELTEAIELSHQALELLSEEHAFALCLNLVSLAGALRYVGDTENAIQVLTDCIPICQAAGNSLGVMADTYDLAELWVMRARLEQAKAVLGHALDWAEQQGVHKLPAASMVHVKLGDLLREQNELQAAEEHLSAGIELSQGRLAIVNGQAYMNLARLQQARGDMAGARDALQQARRAVRGWETPEITADLAAHQARVWLAQGDVPSAVQWVHDSGIRASEQPPYLHEFELLTLARVLIAQGSAEGDEAVLKEALNLLERLLQLSESAGRTGRVMEISMLRALALSQTTPTPEAHETEKPAMAILARTLVLAKPEGYIRMFLDEGEMMARLLYQAAANGIEPEYTGRLLAAFPEFDAELPAHSTGKLVEPLSGREVEVLRLIAMGHSNREIAAELHISLNTVKAHCSNIYAKLGVNSRTKAAAKAEALGILPSQWPPKAD